MHIPAFSRGVLAILALAAGITGPLHAQVFFTESFEAPTWAVNQRLTGTAFDSWTGNDNNNINSLVVQARSTTASDGAQSLFIRDGSGSATPFAQTDWGTNLGTVDTGPGYLEFSFRNADTAGNPTTTGNYAVTFISTAGSTRNFGLTLSDTAGISLTNAAGSVVKNVSYATAGYSPGAWVTFRVDFNEVTNTAGVSLNGNSISGLSVLAGEADAVLWQAGKVQITVGSNAGFGIAGYFDDFTAAVSVPEPSSAAAVLGAFGLLMAVGGRRVRTARGV